MQRYNTAHHLISVLLHIALNPHFLIKTFYPITVLSNKRETPWTI